MTQCDFCSAPNPQHCWVTKPKSWTMYSGNNVYHMSSDAHWAACEQCNTLIMQGSQESLAKRCADESPDNLPYALCYLLHITAFWIGDLKHHPASEHKDDEPAVH